MCGYTYTHTYTLIYVYMYVCCICVYVYVCRSIIWKKFIIACYIKKNIIFFLILINSNILINYNLILIILFMRLFSHFSDRKNRLLL